VEEGVLGLKSWSFFWLFFLVEFCVVGAVGEGFGGGFVEREVVVLGGWFWAGVGVKFFGFFVGASLWVGGGCFFFWGGWGCFRWFGFFFAGVEFESFVRFVWVGGRWWVFGWVWGGGVVFCFFFFFSFFFFFFFCGGGCLEVCACVVCLRGGGGVVACVVCGGWLFFFWRDATPFVI